MNSAFIIPVTSWSPFVLSRRNESISSMKMILGCVFRARLNSPATSLLDSPYHLFVSTEAAMLMNVAPDSLARALAIIVFPHPGGPNNRTPLGAPRSDDEAVKRLGYSRGYMTDSRNVLMILSRPPMSATRHLQNHSPLGECSHTPLKLTLISSGGLVDFPTSLRGKKKGRKAFVG